MVDPDRYGQSYEREYREQSFETTLIRLRRRQVLASYRRFPHRHVLEVGCGLEPFFVEAGGDYATCTIVEQVNRFAAHARDLAAGDGRIRVVEGTFEAVHQQLPGPEPFDFVILSSLLHEVPAPAELLRAVRAVCSPSAAVHVNVPNARSFHRLLAVEMGVIGSAFEPSAVNVTFQHHSVFDRPRLAALLEASGFRVLSAWTNFVKPFTNHQMKRLVEAGLVDEAMLAGLEKMTRHLPDLGCEIFVEATPA